MVFSCHWSFRGIVITSVFSLGFNTNTGGLLYWKDCRIPLPEVERHRNIIEFIFCNNIVPK